MDLAGENFYYQNPLDERGNRYSWHGCPCCVGNIPRTLLMLPTWMYAKDQDSLYVNLFVGSRFQLADVAGTDIEIIQKTDYPWSGDVSITVNPSAATEFGVKIRSPQRSVSTLYDNQPSADGILSITVNGQPVESALEKGYACIQRTWKPGDTIQLQLPMPVQRVKGIDKIEATRGQVALRRGPLVFAVEEVDQPLSQSLADSALLSASWRPDLLRGTIVLTGQWSDGSQLLAIPYFLRKNREPAGGSPGNRRAGRLSRVWVPDQ